MAMSKREREMIGRSVTIRTRDGEIRGQVWSAAGVKTADRKGSEWFVACDDGRYIVVNDHSLTARAVNGYDTVGDATIGGNEIRRQVAIADAERKAMPRKRATTRPARPVPAVEAPVTVPPVAGSVDSVRPFENGTVWRTNEECEEMRAALAARRSVPDSPAGLPESPRMTRAARKASNRELAARMRAAGVEITPESWAAAKSGALAGLDPVTA